jgi:hypothetical protein
MHIDQMKLFKSTIMLLVFGLSIPGALMLVTSGSQQEQAGEVFAQLSATGLQNQTVSYFGNSSGYLVSPLTDNSSNTASQLLPAVVMIHEWWGLNENIKDMANELAKQGYVVLGSITPTSPKF